jgi:hypothetical protein
MVNTPNFYATPPSTTSKRKRKTACLHFMVQRSDQEPGETLVGLYERRGSKCRIVSIPDTEVVQRYQLAWSNEDVNVELQMRTMTVHCSMIDSDTAHINNKVELSALEQGAGTYHHRIEHKKKWRLVSDTSH